MRHTLTSEVIKTQLTGELEAVRGFEKNSKQLLDQMSKAYPFDDLEGQARGLRYNQQMAHLYLARASAVLELLGICREVDINIGDDLEGFSQELE